MSPKVAHPTTAQAEVLKNNGLMPFVYAVLHENEYSLTVVNRINGFIKVLQKEGKNDDRRNV